MRRRAHRQVSGRRENSVWDGDWGLATLASLVAAPLLYYFRFGYGYGFSDQDEFLPLLLARIHPGLLEGDWFVSSQLEAYNIRTIFGLIIEGPARLMGAENAVLGLYVLVGLSTVLALGALARRMGLGPVASVIGTVLALAVLPRWTLGGNSAAGSMLVPSMLAWSMGLWGAVALIGRRATVAGVLIGLTAWIQILVGAQLGFACLCGLVWRDRGFGRDALLFAGASLALAAPAAWMLWRAGAGVSADSFAVLAYVRAPHHYLPQAFPLADYLQMALLTAGGIVALRRTRLSRSAATNRMLVGILAAVGGLILAGFGGSALGIEHVLALQPFKATVLSGVILAVALAGLVPTVRFPVWIWMGAIGLGALLFSWFILGGSIGGKPASRDIGGIAGAADWLRNESLVSATAAVPPSASGFRLRSQRAVVVTFKAYPFTAAGPGEWFARLSDWAPGVLDAYSSAPAIGGTDLLDDLDAAYEALSPTDAAALADRYGADYVVRMTAFPPGDSLFVLKARQNEFNIYLRADR